MKVRNSAWGRWVLVVAVFSFASQAQAQSVGESRWVVDLGAGIDVSVNGNVNSGAIGRLQGQAAAILPIRMATCTVRVCTSSSARATS